MHSRAGLDYQIADLGGTVTRTNTQALANDPEIAVVIDGNSVQIYYELPSPGTESYTLILYGDVSEFEFRWRTISSNIDGGANKRTTHSPAENTWGAYSFVGSVATNIKRDSVSPGSATVTVELDVRKVAGTVPVGTIRFVLTCTGT